MRCSGSASFFSKETCKQKNGPQRIFQKKNLKTYRRDDYVKSVKKIYTNKKHTHKKNKRLLADDLKKEQGRLRTRGRSMSDGFEAEDLNSFEAGVF